MSPDTSRPPAESGARAHQRLGLALFVFLLSLYLLAFSGAPHSSDGIAMLATGESLVRRADLDMNAYLWMGLQQGSFGPDGELYSRKGMGQTLASLPLAWLGLKARWLGLAQASLLLGPLVAAATACALFVAALAMGQGSGAALAVALLYGLATPALPYSKYDFSDPLTGLSLMLAFLALLRFRRGHSLLAAAACGVALGVACLTRTTSLATVPLFVLAGAISPRHPRPEGAPDDRSAASVGTSASLPTGAETAMPGDGTAEALSSVFAVGWRSGIRSLLAFATGLAPLLLTAAWFNHARFGNPLTSGYLEQESFSGNLLVGVAGLLVSPGKGLFLYAPILLLAPFGWARLRRSDGAVAWLILGICAAHVLIYGKWFMWHGGYAWGPRFLMPALPFAALALAPIWSRWRRPVLVLGVVSVVPQVLGTLVHFTPFQDSLLSTGLPLYDPATYWQWHYSPLLGQWQYLLAALRGDGMALDFAWAQDVLGAARLDAVSLVALLAQTALAAWALCRVARRHGSRLLPAAIAALLLVAPATLARDHAAGAHPLDAALALIEASERPGDAILLTRPADSATLTDRYRGSLPTYGLPNATGGWLPRVGAGHERLWLLTDPVPLEQNEVESWLAAWGYQLSATGGDTWRLALYARPSGGADTLASGVAFAGGVTLVAAECRLGSDAVAVRLVWRADEAVDRDLKVFVQAYDNANCMLAQHDGAPDLWRRPTTSWQPHEDVEDRHGLLLPSGSTPAHLLIGLYDAVTGERLSVAGGDALRLDLTGR